MRSTIRQRLVVHAFAVIAVAMGAASAPAEELQAPSSLPPEIKRIQQSLGGPVVERFATLRANGDKRLSAAEEKVAAVRQQQAVEALRQAAVELDAAANRLERLELYRQADALRDQAQHLRLDARGLSGAENNEGKPSAARPWDWNNATPTAPTIVPTPAPTLAPSQPPSAAPTPANPDNPSKTPVPSLQPAPQPD